MLQFDKNNRRLKTISTGDCFKINRKVYTIESALYRFNYLDEIPEPEIPAEINFFVKVFNLQDNSVDYLTLSVQEFLTLYNDFFADNETE